MARRVRLRNGRCACLFPFLADSIQHVSIKVYLSAIRSLYVEQGFPGPMLNCLRLQRVMRGIKRFQGSPVSSRLPITDSIMTVIRQALNVTSPPIIACSGQPVPWVTLASYAPLNLLFPT